MPIQSKHPKLSLQQIEQWEINNSTIPQPYKDFLLKHNGGTNGDKNTFKVTKMKGEFGFHEFFGIHEGLGGLDYIQATYTKRNRFPDSYFAIASDVAGNLILMGQAAENLGQVFFWYHENEVDDGKKPHEKNIYKIAKDLKTFIAKLYEEPVVSYGKLSDIYDGNDDGIKALLASDWEVEMPDELNETLIKRAVLSKRFWLVEELIARKANLSGTIEKAMTMDAAEILELLLKAGANTEERNLSNYTPLQSAVLGNKPIIVSLLLKYGADKNLKNEFNKTPLDIANSKKSRGIDMDEVIRLLSE